MLEKESIQKIISKNFEFNLELIGPTPLPLKNKTYTVNRSHHVNKKSRDQFQIKKQARFYIIKLSLDPSLPQTVKNKIEEILNILILQMMNEIMENKSIHISYSFFKSFPIPSRD